MPTFEVTSYTKARAQEIVDAEFVGISFVDGDLILTRADGKTVNAGQAKGELGDRGPIGEVSEADLVAREANYQSQLDTTDSNRASLLSTAQSLQSTVNGRYSWISNLISDSAANGTDISALQSDLNNQKTYFVRGTNPRVEAGNNTLYVNCNNGGMRVNDGSIKYYKYPQKYYAYKDAEQDLVLNGSADEYITGTYLSVEVDSTSDVLDIHYQVDSACTSLTGILAIKLYHRLYRFPPGGSAPAYTEETAAPELIIRGDVNSPFGGRCNTAEGRYLMTGMSTGTHQFRLYGEEINGGFMIQNHTALSILHYRST